jgi:AcrR family transcriptional regulator
MSTEAPPRLDRRHARRAETIEQLLELAVQVMAEQGVAGLSLGEVARRMGVRPPSLYVYVESKNAVYDVVYARGWDEVHEALQAVPDPEAGDDVAAYLLRLVEVYVRWSVEHPVHAQLMGWRTVPGYEPSAGAYEHATTAFVRTRGLLARLQELGLLSPEVDGDELMRAWTILSTGVVTQQLANAPGSSFDEGPFTRMLPQLVAMFVGLYAPAGRAHSPHDGEPRRPRGPRTRRAS